MYQLALPHFPHNEKLAGKIAALKERVQSKTRESQVFTGAVSPPGKGRFGSMLSLKKEPLRTFGKRQSEDFDADYEEHAGGDGLSSDENVSRPRRKKRATAKSFTRGEIDLDTMDCEDPTVSPRTIHLLSIINSRDVSQIKLLKGVGARKAEAIVDCLCEMDQTPDLGFVSDQPQFQVNTLAELSTLKGVGIKTVENMRNGVLV
jgi:DNA uptake protein ComE-like DNA-binding protein